MADYIPENDQSAYYMLREERNKLLENSDSMMVSDRPLSEAKLKEWKTYRQALRDLPTTQTEPKTDYTNGKLINVTWPTKPE